MDHHFHQKLLLNLCKKNILLVQHLHHIYPKSNTFIEWQIKTFKTALSTCQEAKQSIEDLLLNIRTQPIDPHLPSPREILHYRTEECPGRPSHSVDMENICNYLISKKTTQKENPWQGSQGQNTTRHHSRSESSFSQSSGPHQYTEGSITSYTSTPRSYIIEL